MLEKESDQGVRSPREWHIDHAARESGELGEATEVLPPASVIAAVRHCRLIVYTRRWKARYIVLFHHRRKAPSMCNPGKNGLESNPPW